MWRRLGQKLLIAETLLGTLELAFQAGQLFAGALALRGFIHFLLINKRHFKSGGCL